MQESAYRYGNILLRMIPVSIDILSYRKYKLIDKDVFFVELFVLHPPEDLEKMVDLYNNTLIDLGKGYAPLRAKQTPHRTLLALYNNDIQPAKRHKIYCERLWIITFHYEVFTLARLYVRDSLSTIIISSQSAYMIRKLFSV